MIRPDLPFQDLARMFSIKNYVSQSSPLIKAFPEFVANQNLFTGQPLADARLPQGQFQREKMKNWILSNMRAYGYLRSASQEDTKSLDFYLNTLLGIKGYKINTAQGAAQYNKQVSGERRALFQKNKKALDNKILSSETAKTLVGMK